MAECLTVDQDVAGSTPVSHPRKMPYRKVGHLLMILSKTL